MLLAEGMGTFPESYALTSAFSFKVGGEQVFKLGRVLASGCGWREPRLGRGDALCREQPHGVLHHGLTWPHSESSKEGSLPSRVQPSLLFLVLPTWSPSLNPSLLFTPSFSIHIVLSASDPSHHNAKKAFPVSVALSPSPVSHPHSSSVPFLCRNTVSFSSSCFLLL